MDYNWAIYTLPKLTLTMHNGMHSHWNVETKELRYYGAPFQVYSVTTSAAKTELSSVRMCVPLSVVREGLCVPSDQRGLTDSVVRLICRCTHETAPRGHESSHLHLLSFFSSVCLVSDLSLPPSLFVPSGQIRAMQGTVRGTVVTRYTT